MKGIREKLRGAVNRKLAKAKLPLATLQAQMYLRKHGPLRVLVDSSVLGHGITHVSAWIPTGPQKWGPIDIQSGYLGRVPVHSPDNDGRVYREVRYLPGIAHLARHGYLELLTSAELKAEQFRQPAGRFQGYGYADFNVFDGIPLNSVDGFHLDLNAPEDTQLKRVDAQHDPLFQALRAKLSKKQSLDAFHIFTAERFGLFCFLHVDFPLAEQVKQNARKQPFSELKTRLLLPSEFGRLIGLQPVDTNLLALETEDFPTHGELHIEGQRRKGPQKPVR